MKLLRFKRDRRQEFESEALPHLDALYRTARWMLADASAAEDAVQETYLKAWRSYDTFEKGTNVRAWLFTILSNTVKDARARVARDRTAPDSEDQLAAQNAKPIPAAAITDPGVTKALEQLSEDRRRVVWMADVEGFSYLEVSKALGVPVGTVMSRLSRARKQLKGFLQQAAPAAAQPVRGNQTA